MIILEKVDYVGAESVGVYNGGVSESGVSKSKFKVTAKNPHS